MTDDTFSFKTEIDEASYEQAIAQLKRIGSAVDKLEAKFLKLGKKGGAADIRNAYNAATRAIEKANSKLRDQVSLVQKATKKDPYKVAASLLGHDKMTKTDRQDAIMHGQLKGSLKEIAAQAGVSIATIRRDFKEMGLSAKDAAASTDQLTASITRQSVASKTAAVGGAGGQGGGRPPTGGGGRGTGDGGLPPQEPRRRYGMESAQAQYEGARQHYLTGKAFMEPVDITWPDRLKAKILRVSRVFDTLKGSQRGAFATNKVNKFENETSQLISKLRKLNLELLKQGKIVKGFDTKTSGPWWERIDPKEAKASEKWYNLRDQQQDMVKLLKTKRDIARANKNIASAEKERRHLGKSFEDRAADYDPELIDALKHRKAKLTEEAIRLEKKLGVESSQSGKKQKQSYVQLIKSSSAYKRKLVEIEAQLGKISGQAMPLRQKETLEKLRKQAKLLATPVFGYERGEKGRYVLNRYNQDVEKLSQSTKQLEKDIKGADKSQRFFNSRFARFSIIMSGMAASMFVFQELRQIFYAIIAPIKAADAALINLRKELAGSEEEVQMLFKAAKQANLSGTMGIEDAAKELTELKNQGYSASEAMIVLGEKIKQLDKISADTASHGFKKFGATLSQWIERAFRDTAGGFGESAKRMAESLQRLGIKDEIQKMLEKEFKAAFELEGIDIDLINAAKKKIEKELRKSGYESVALNLDKYLETIVSREDKISKATLRLPWLAGLSAEEERILQKAVEIQVKIRTQFEGEDPRAVIHALQEASKVELDPWVMRTVVEGKEDVEYVANLLKNADQTISQLHRRTGAIIPQLDLKQTQAIEHSINQLEELTSQYPQFAGIINEFKKSLKFDRRQLELKPVIDAWQVVYDKVGFMSDELYASEKEKIENTYRENLVKGLDKGYAEQLKERAMLGLNIQKIISKEIRLTKDQIAQQEKLFTSTGYMTEALKSYRDLMAQFDARRFASISGDPGSAEMIEMKADLQTYKDYMKLRLEHWQDYYKKTGLMAQQHFDYLIELASKEKAIDMAAKLNKEEVEKRHQRRLLEIVDQANKSKINALKEIFQATGTTLPILREEQLSVIKSRAGKIRKTLQQELTLDPVVGISGIQPDFFKAIDDKEVDKLIEKFEKLEITKNKLSEIKQQQQPWSEFFNTTGKMSDEFYNQQTREIELLHDQFVTLTDDATAGMQMLNSAMRDLDIQKLQDSNDVLDGMSLRIKNLEESARSAAEKSEDAITEFVEGSRSTLKDGLFGMMQGEIKGIGGLFIQMGNTFKTVVDEMVAKALAAKLNEALFGGVAEAGGGEGWLNGAMGFLLKNWNGPSAAGGAAGGVTNVGLWGGFAAHGMAFEQHGVRKFASGGVVTRPTNFAYAGGKGLMGEAGPEGILPLKRTKTGDLGVQVATGGDTINISPTIVVQAPQGRLSKQSMSQLQTQLGASLRRNIARNG